MDELGITADVQQKIQDIKKANDEDVKNVKTDAGLTEVQKKEKLKELRKKRIEAIEALLTADQKKKADELRKAFEAKNKNRRE